MSRRRQEGSMEDLQPPVRNPSWIGVHVYAPTGEFSPSTTDLRMPGRGLDLAIVRKYRSSRAAEIGGFGRGWSSKHEQHCDAAGDAVVSHTALVRHDRV